MQLKRTDLAIEAHEMLMEAAQELSGVSVQQEDKGGAHIARVSIETLRAQTQMGKPIGRYITVEFPEADLSEGDAYEALCKVVAEELSSLLSLQKNSKILVVGLGNRNITPDALGPKVIEKLVVTRHLFSYMPEVLSDGMRSVCAIAPGVLGLTGMETEEVIRGVVDKVRPDAVIVVDALAARSTARISATVQICDTGISPGAGVGNKRKALDKGSLGVPVIAVGVPTVIDAVTISADVLESASKNGEDTAESLSAALSEMDAEAKQDWLRRSVPGELSGFIVTPKDVDLLLDRVSKLVANGINFALHQNLSFEDIALYTS
ncbi:MAG: GPR endopeptidase [Ruminococcaceae bacterium]|nr:GPR endopeptidase [Oscillospiraceae bacterium]